MRKIGSLSSLPQAQRFHRYLTSKGIVNQIDEQGANWEVWIHEEDQVAAGREALAAFTAAPDAPEFHVKEFPPPPPPPIAVEAPPVRSQNFEQSAGAPLTVALIAISIAITIATDFGARSSALMGQIKISNQLKSQPAFVMPPEVLQGEVWRLYTPMFLHLNFLHLLFNMYMLWILGGIIERERSTRFLLWLVLLIAPASHLIQWFFFDGNFGGMSGVIYGLFGFLWLRSVVRPGEGFMMPSFVVMQMMLWLVLGMMDLLGPIANGAHLGGLVAGAVIGALPALQRR